MFESVKGNQNICKLLENAVKNNNIVHSYLFIGEEGIGKKMMAIQFAKSILCQSKDERPCNNCKSCIEFNSGNNINFYIIDGAEKAIKVEQIRNMQNKISEKPIDSEYKIYLINDAELMTTEAQNCLLKTLEEPPEYIIIILISSNENKILNTIKSRCMKLYFNNLKNNEIREILHENFNINQVNDAFLNATGGSMKKALLIKENFEKYEQISKIFDIINKENLVSFINDSSILYESKDDIFNILDYMNILISEKIKVNNDEYKFNYANCIFIIEEVKKRLRANSNYDMSIDYLLMNIWEELNGERSSWH